MSQTLNCTYHKNQQCRVCLDVDLSCEAQLQNKGQLLAQQLGISLDQIGQNPSAPKRFRDKMKLQISGSCVEEKLLRFGFLDPDELVVKADLTHCPLHHHCLEELIPMLKKLLVAAQVPPYDVHQKTGEAKGVIAFFSPTTKQSYLRLVLRSKEALDRIKKQLHLLNHVDVISINIQPTAHALLEGEEEIFLKGEYIEHSFNDCHLYLSPQGFVQTNTAMAQKLYQRAAEWAKETKASKALDLYCGHGPFSFFLHINGISCTGVEVNAQAVELAKKTAKDFYAEGAALDFLCAKADEMKSLVQEIKPQLIVVNPPRAGLRQGVELLLNSGAKALLYSSCSSESLVNDLARLKTKFKVRKVEIFDMFPHSQHFETLVYLDSAS